jgi:hypothetical protein
MTSRLIICMQYLGAMVLLGRLTKKLSQDDQDCVDRAFADINKIMEELESEYVFKRCIPEGYGLFSRTDHDQSS